eukprot:244006_1
MGSDWSFDQIVSTTCTICCAPIFSSYLFSAIIIAYISNCDVNENDIIMDPNLYLKIGGFGFLITSLLTLFTYFTICKSHEKGGFTQSKGQAVISAAAVILETIWIIIGCILYKQLNNECQQSSVGKMILSFVIITSILNSCACIAIIRSCIVPDQGCEQSELQPLTAV